MANFTLKSFIGSPSGVPSIFWPWRRRLPCSVMCLAKFGGGGPTPLPYSFSLSWSTEELAPCATGFSQALLFWATGSSFAVPGFSWRIVGVFWICFFLMRRVSQLPFHQPVKVCILESHLRRRRCVERAWFNTHPAIGFPRSYRHPRTLRCNRTRCGGGTCRYGRRRHTHHCWSRLGHNSFFFFFNFESFVLVWSSLSSWNSLYSKWSWNGWYFTNEEDCSTHHVWNSLWSTCLRVGVWCECDGFEFLGPNSSCQTTNPEQLCGSVKHASLWGLDLW